MKIQITLEIDDTAETFGDAVGIENSVHEALCQFFHEGNPEAEEWLKNYVTNVE